MAIVFTIFIVLKLRFRYDECAKNLLALNAIRE